MKSVMTCPVCRAASVSQSHRHGAWERGLLTWMGVLPFRCGQCRTRFYKIALKDSRRRRHSVDVVFPVDRPRAPRWMTNVAAVVTLHASDQTNVSLKGIAENASLEGARVRLPSALPEGSPVSVALEGGLSRPGSVHWTMPDGESGVIHGIRFQVPLERRADHSRPLRRLRLRQSFRRGLIVLIGAATIAIAAYGLVWLIEGMRTYDPKYYEPKDIEREGQELQRRLEELKRLRKP